MFLERIQAVAEVVLQAYRQRSHDAANELVHSAWYANRLTAHYGIPTFAHYFIRLLPEQAG